MFGLYSYIIFCNQNGNFEVFSQNPITEAKEMHSYSNFLSRMLSRINLGTVNPVLISRQCFNEYRQSLTVLPLLPLM